jgi:glutaredoxin
MTQARGTVTGRRGDHRIILYALSTCIWCKRTRQLLENEEVTFDYVYVDLLEATEREQAKREIRQWNPSTSFPTIVIDNQQSVVGYKPEKIKELL